MLASQCSFFVTVQYLWLWLADGPRDARKGSEQNRNTDDFVQAKRERSAGHGLRIRAVGLNGVGQILSQMPIGSTTKYQGQWSSGRVW